MIDQSEVFSLFLRWLDNRSRLRVDASLSVMSFSFECAIVRADEPLLGLRLDNGMMELRFDETWGFDFAAPEALRVPSEQRIGGSTLGDKRYEFGETVVALRHSGGRIVFLEIVRAVR